MLDSRSLTSGLDEVWFWFIGSEQEFDGRPISRGFPESDEFGLGDGHTLSLEEQIA